MKQKLSAVFNFLMGIGLTGTAFLVFSASSPIQELFNNFDHPQNIMPASVILMIIIFLIGLFNLYFGYRTLKKQKFSSDDLISSIITSLASLFIASLLLGLWSFLSVSQLYSLTDQL